MHFDRAHHRWLLRAWGGRCQGRILDLLALKEIGNRAHLHAGKALVWEVLWDREPRCSYFLEQGLVKPQSHCLAAPASP